MPGFMRNTYFETGIPLPAVRGEACGNGDSPGEEQRDSRLLSHTYSPDSYLTLTLSGAVQYPASPAILNLNEVSSSFTLPRFKDSAPAVLDLGTDLGHLHHSRRACLVDSRAKHLLTEPNVPRLPGI